MEGVEFTYYQEDDFWIGWLDEYPDYWTQARTLAELKENLRDNYKTAKSL